MHQAIPIVLTVEEGATLATWSRSRTMPARLVVRAKIVLLASEGADNSHIARELGINRLTVKLWRSRFASQRLAGIEQDRSGRGRKAHKRKHWSRTIVEVTLHTKPKNATHWSVRTLADYLGIEKSMVHRVWQAHELAPHRVRTFKLSRDPHFIEKLVDVVGLYLNPPENAIVISVDEKSQIQALERSQPGLPLKKGRCGTMTHDFKRNGTTTLFAALTVATGKLIGKCMKRHRHQEWLKFLRLIDQETDADLDLHLIADNYSTHKHPNVKAWLARHPRFHMHFVPTGSSWLNMVERWFREITTKRIRRGNFPSVPALENAIHQYIATHNEDPKPFVWKADLKDILPKIARAHQALANG